MKRLRHLAAIALLGILVFALRVFFRCDSPERTGSVSMPSSEEESVAPKGGDDSALRPKAGIGKPKAATPDAVDPEDVGRGLQEPERAARQFDGLVRRWSGRATGEVTMDDVDEFVGAFGHLTGKMKKDSLRRALNLIPDRNVMLLAGILMDRRQDGETLKTVFQDVVNREEKVKKPILESIYRDRTHPCWPDVQWIFEVTGESPASVDP